MEFKIFPPVCLMLSWVLRVSRGVLLQLIHSKSNKAGLSLTLTLCIGGGAGNSDGGRQLWVSQPDLPSSSHLLAANGKQIPLLQRTTLS